MEIGYLARSRGKDRLRTIVLTLGVVISSDISQSFFYEGKKKQQTLDIIFNFILVKSALKFSYFISQKL